MASANPINVIRFRPSIHIEMARGARTAPETKVAADRSEQKIGDFHVHVASKGCGVDVAWIHAAIVTAARCGHVKRVDQVSRDGIVVAYRKALRPFPVAGCLRQDEIEIGRASCRERGTMWRVADGLQIKKETGEGERL